MRRLVVVFLLGILIGCKGDASRSQVIQSTSSSSDSQANESTALRQQAPGRIAMGGPGIRTDSSGSVPRLVVEGEQNILLLPVSMARVLSDSLPSFTPRRLSEWTPAMVTTIVSGGSGVVLPSVVLGDFNGDGRTDVAMEGRSKQTDATFFLLAPSDTAPRSRILFISRGEAVNRSANEFANDYITIVHPQQLVSPYTGDTLKLRTDAVQYAVIEKASIIYYLDHGVVRDYSASD